MADERLYTEEEVQVRERLASIQSRTESLEDWLKTHTEEGSDYRAKTELALKEILNTVRSNDTHTEQCRADVQKEMRDNYVTSKMHTAEVATLKSQMFDITKKLDWFWLKIMGAAGSAGSVGAFVTDIILRTVGK